VREQLHGRRAPSLAFLRAEEPGATVMRRYLRRAQSGSFRLLLNVVNLGEVFYRLLQLTNETLARLAD
jgi:predicted nucleic acid-binding protein